MKYFYSNYIGKSAKYGEKYGLKVNPEQAGVNDEIDAFRHCFSQVNRTGFNPSKIKLKYVSG